MEILEYLKSVLFGIVQGITEWLPVSSTGHMLLLDEFVKLNVSEAFRNVFMVVIQFGSILAVLVMFFHKLNPFSPKKSTVEKKQTVTLWLKVLVATVPAGIIGVFFKDNIHQLFYNVPVIAAALIIYGVAFILLENRKWTPEINSLNEMSYKTALFIGAFQILALIPGTSRSGATIVGAVLLGASRYVAAEFSFFLAVPTMLGASLWELKDAGFSFTANEWIILLIGMVTAFIVSLAAIKFLMDFVKKHNFKPFGWYRIALGLVVIACYAFGVINA